MTRTTLLHWRSYYYVHVRLMYTSASYLGGCDVTLCIPSYRRHYILHRIFSNSCRPLQFKFSVVSLQPSKWIRNSSNRPSATDIIQWLAFVVHEMPLQHARTWRSTDKRQRQIAWHDRTSDCQDMTGRQRYTDAVWSPTCWCGQRLSDGDGKISLSTNPRPMHCLPIRQPCRDCWSKVIKEYPDAQTPFHIAAHFNVHV